MPDKRDRALALLEQITDYLLMDALEGKFKVFAWTDAHAAFADCDVKRLERIESIHSRQVNFIEPDVVFAKGAPKDDPEGKKNGRTALEKRISILRKRKGTRLYARALLEKHHGG